MNVVVFGATGVLGRHVLPRLLERGHTVRAIVRRDDQAERLHRLGFTAQIGDIVDAESVERAVEGCDAALHLATAIPRPGEVQDWAPNDRIRREGTQHLLAACARGLPPLYPAKHCIPMRRCQRRTE